jgi:Ca2+-binding EF-hand superfamily protein
MLDETRVQLDSEGVGKVHIDKLQQYVSGLLNEILDPERLRTAFNQFDADQDNMLSLDEFDFFMDGFAKEHNRLRDSQLVKQMVSIAKENCEKGTDKFTIDNMITALRKVWKMPC